jgi:hypothetical protein
MIDNFEQIKGLMSFKNENEFYFLQILQRKKDHPGKRVGGSDNHSRLIKPYYIYSVEQLETQKEEIIKLCEVFGARAYINLNKRNAFDMGLELLAEVAHNIKSNHLRYFHRVYSTVCGRHHSDKDKTWVIDIDTPHTYGLLRFLKSGRLYIDMNEEFDGSTMVVMQVIDCINQLEPLGIKQIAALKTKNGLHLITKPFNSQKFSQEFPNIDVHKNNPTVLYII